MIVEAIKQKLREEAEAYIKCGLTTLDQAEAEKVKRKRADIGDLARIEALRCLDVYHWAEVQYLTDDDVKEFFNLVLRIIIMH